jgi:ATP-binding cassette subfamily F protein 1
MIHLAQAIKMKEQQKSWEKQEKRLRELKRSGQSKAKATETVLKRSKREPGARSQKKTNDDIASGISTATTDELLKRVKEYAVKHEFAEVPELARPVLKVSKVHFDLL